MKTTLLIAALVAFTVAFFSLGNALQSKMDSARSAVQSHGGTAGIAYHVD